MQRLYLWFLLLIVIALAGCASIVDSSPPEIAVSVRDADVIRTGDTITVSVVDAQSGIATVAVDFDGANLLLETVASADRSRDALTFSVPISKALVVGETYRLDVKVVNGFGLRSERSITLVAAAADEAAAPVQTGPSVSWLSPAPGSTVPGVVELTARASSAVGIAAATFAIANDGGAVIADATAVGGGVYAFSWNARDYPAGEYVVTFSARDADGVTRDVQVKLIVGQSPDADPSLAFVAPSPAPGQRIAGLIDVGVAFDAPRGFGSVSLALAVDGLGSNSVAIEVDEVAGSFTARLNTLRLEPGDYTLLATVRDETGATATSTLGFTVLTPFGITSPSEGTSVGDGVDRQRVSIVVGANGTIDDFVQLTSAVIFVDGAELGTATIRSAGDNQIAVYSWDTAVSVASVHDAAASGDRIITVLVGYTYDDGEGPVSSSRFTPGVLLNFQP